MNDSILIDCPNYSETESEFPDETIEQLLARADSMIAAVNSKLQKPATTQTITVRASNELEAAIDSVIQIPSNVMDESDDDVIFIGEQQQNVSVINLCSPDRGPRSSRILKSNNNGRLGKECTTNKDTAQPTVAKVSEVERNTVICAICMDSSVGRQPHSTSCGHIFCGACIKESIIIRKKCPLCNKSLTCKNIFPVFI